VIPAITHVDGTGRLQTVILNTSFNWKGEPIVNTPAEAHGTFRRSGMDVLVLARCLVNKERNAAPSQRSGPQQRDDHAISQWNGWAFRDRFRAAAIFLGAQPLVADPR
jgi:hypothetical protein